MSQQRLCPTKNGTCFFSLGDPSAECANKSLLERCFVLMAGCDKHKKRNLFWNMRTSCRFINGTHSFACLRKISLKISKTYKKHFFQPPWWQMGDRRLGDGWVTWRFVIFGRRHEHRGPVARENPKVEVAADQRKRKL